MHLNSVDHSAKNAARLERLLDSPAYGLAWRYACRLALTREDAEDLLQDVLAHALLHLDQLRLDTAFAPWLLRIVRTRFLMARRSAAQPAAADATPRELPAPPAWGLDANAGQALELAHALRGLPPEQRALLSLHYIEGLGADELAAVHGVSRGAVEQRLHRARHALRRALGAQADPQSCTAVKEG
jgi:RNA polymerase sigma-70 factor, ECF subfamily